MPRQLTWQLHMTKALTQVECAYVLTLSETEPKDSLSCANAVCSDQLRYTLWYDDHILQQKCCCILRYRCSPCKSGIWQNTNIASGVLLHTSQVMQVCRVTVAAKECCKVQLQHCSCQRGQGGPLARLWGIAGPPGRYVQPREMLGQQ